MRGIATIDWQPDADAAAVWVTSRTGLNVGHHNAVTVDFAADSDAERKVHQLTRSSWVLLTDGSVLPEDFIVGDALRVADLHDWIGETLALQEAVRQAIAAYKKRTRSASMTDPVFVAPPEADVFITDNDSPKGRTFGTANFLQRVWSQWLRTDEERRRRTVQPRTGASPWVMPAELNADTVADFPSRLADRVVVQPVV